VDSFRIRASRADKSFPLTSPEIERELGADVQERTGWSVELEGAALEIGVEVLYDRVLVTYGRVPGPGGLPVGVSGRVGLLLSGGIDSPVAGYLALKRGARVTPIHFHSRPFGNWRGAEKRARKIVRLLRTYGMEPRFYAVPIGRQQREITVRGPAAFRVLLYRRLMVRVAEVLVHREGGKALVSGESLGQVASQTLEGLAATADAATIPILRPLIGMDKQEIVDRAEAIGTFDLSQIPADDCCRFLMPQHVVTRPRLEDVLEAEATVDMNRLAEEALAQASCIEVEARMAQVGG
jgi:thiamine biosynthesis protein ThiI